MFPNRIVLIIFATFLFIFSSKQQYALAANDPGEYVMKMTKSAIDTLTNQSISQEEKENQFGKLFDKNFDVPSISRFVLGKYWKQASTDQKKKFIKTFRNYIVKTYSSRFGEYSGEQLELLNTENESNPKIFLVHTALQRQDAPIIKVDWRIGKKKDRFVILDIVIEGIRTATTPGNIFNGIFFTIFSPFSSSMQ